MTPIKAGYKQAGCHPERSEGSGSWLLNIIIRSSPHKDYRSENFLSSNYWS